MGHREPGGSHQEHESFNLRLTILACVARNRNRDFLRRNRCPPSRAIFSGGVRRRLLSVRRVLEVSQRA